jgi:SAM-dependent methyltransferase
MSARDFHNDLYSKTEERRYPNEELVRFFGRNYFHRDDRKAVRVLEVGSGTGANLRMIAHEGFDFYGIDASQFAISKAQCGGCDQPTCLVHGCVRQCVGDMRDTGFPAWHFDVVCDVFASYCLNETEFRDFLVEVKRLLKPGGRFFSYTPSKASDVYVREMRGLRFEGAGQRSDFIDMSTLPGISAGAYAGNNYPFRFISPWEMSQSLNAVGLRAEYLETVGRTYQGGKEYFEFVVVEGVNS